MKNILFALVLVLILCTSSQAYFIEFDGEGSTNYAAIDEWSLDEQIKQDPNTGTYGDLFTYQDSDTGLFTESFTVKLLQGTNTDTASEYTYTDLFIDINLNGQYFDDSNIVFNSGGAQVYKDNNGDLNFDAGDDVDIATLSLSDALPSNLTGSLLGINNLQMNVDTIFTFDTVNQSYFGNDEQYLTSKDWLLSFVATDIEQDSISDPTYNVIDSTYDGDTDADDYIIEWDLTASQAEFKAVPEPTTLLLFGTGLLGLAAFGRKKFMNKN